MKQFKLKKLPSLLLFTLSAATLVTLAAGVSYVPPDASMACVVGIWLTAGLAVALGLIALQGLDGAE